MMEYLKWQIIIIIYLFTSVFIIFFKKYDYDVLENNSLQSFGKGRIGFLSDKILYNVVKVGENEIFINTPEITEHTVYKIKDKFYQIHWVNNSILVEEMKVPYVEDIKILDGNENNKK